MSEPLDAIVTGAVDFGDHDRVVRVLTARDGRGAILARGARTGRKPWAALLEAGSRVSLELKRGRGPLPLVLDVAPVHRPRRARDDLERLALLAYGVELCAALAPEHGEAERLFRLTAAWLDLLEGDAAPGPASRQALEGKALTFAGYAPTLVMCAVCGERLTAPAAFVPDAGGGTHVACAPGPAVDPDALIRLEALRRTPLADTPGVRPARPLGLLTDFAVWHLGAPLRARALVDELEAAPQS